MRVVVIGGTGHIGSYLVPRLFGRGYETVCVSRRQRQPYFVDERWAMVDHAVIDRAVEEQRGRDIVPLLDAPGGRLRRQPQCLEIQVLRQELLTSE